MSGVIEGSAIPRCDLCGCPRGARFRASRSPRRRRMTTPIVPDSQFEQALPPLDPELNQPLEPIDPNAPAFPPVPGPVEDTPLGDPALTEPLPPISGFDVQPVEDAADRRRRWRGAAAGPLHPRRRGHGRDRARRPLPQPFRARGCGRRGGQRRDDPGARRARTRRSPSACSAPRAIMTRSRPRRSSNCPTSRGGCGSTITVAAGRPLRSRRDRDRRRRHRPARHGARLPAASDRPADPRGGRRGGRGERAASPAAGGLSLPRARPQGHRPRSRDPCRRLYAAAQSGAARALRRLHHRGRPRLRRRAMSASSPASIAATSTTAARSTTCGRRWSRPGCSAPSRPSRC